MLDFVLGVPLDLLDLHKIGKHQKVHNSYVIKILGIQCNS
jgi:hypothetical protein